MKRLRDVTFGEAFGALVPYRPFIALTAVIALLLVALPGPDGSSSVDPSGDAAASATALATGDADVTTTTGGEYVPGAATASPTAAPPSFGSDTSGAPVAAAEATTGGGATAAGPTAPSGTWPGVGTPAALGAPDCDRSTGFLRMYTKAWNLPCVPLWPSGADNGGATGMGVTGDEIRIVMYIPKGSPASDNAMRALGINDSPEQQEESSRGIVDIYARHAELYGRRVKLIKVVGSGDTAEAYRADAIDIVNKHRPFAMFPSNGGACPAMYAAAQRGVQTTCGVLASKANLDASRGNHWDTSVYPNDVEQAFVFAEVIGKQLAGRKARWAGDPTMRLQQRKFGWIYLDSPETAPANKVFESELARYGVKLTTKVGVAPDLAQASEQTRTAVARMKSDGVNVVFPHAIAEFTVHRHATSANYFPEWFAGSLFGATFFVRTLADPQQARALYGIKNVPILPPSEKLDRNQLYQWEHGRQPTAKLLALQIQPAVHTIFAGIHLAGPQLTALTFRKALFERLPTLGGAAQNAVTSHQRGFGFRGVWPNEKQGQASMSMVDDVGLGWWSSTAVCEDEAGKQGPGCLMMPAGGRRTQIGKLPNEEPPMFVEAGAVGQLSDLPATERSPMYPNKKGCPSRQACYGSG